MGKFRKKQYSPDEGRGEDIDLDAPAPGMSMVTKLGLFGILFVLPALQFSLMVFWAAMGLGS
jgi:hypothetical protein